MLFSQLHREIIYNILEFAGFMKYRNGKYMFQISKNDNRYELLEQIPKPVPFYLFGRHGIHITLRTNLCYISEVRRLGIRFDIPTTILTYSYLNLLYNEQNRDVNLITHVVFEPANM